MSNSKVDILMDNFLSQFELSQLNTEELEELNDRVNNHISVMIDGTKETESDRMDEMKSESELDYESIELEFDNINN